MPSVGVERGEAGRADARWVKHTRWALVKDPGALSTSQRLVLERLRRDRSVLHRAYLLKEELSDVYRLREFGAAHQFLDRGGSPGRVGRGSPRS